MQVLIREQWYSEVQKCTEYKALYHQRGGDTECASGHRYDPPHWEYIDLLLVLQVWGKPDRGV